MSRESEEEIFCLKYEVNALSEVVIHNEAERWVYKCMYPQVEAEHLARYQFAANNIDNKRVLDIAGGSGYGAYMLAMKGDPIEVYSVDLDPDAVRYAEHRYKHDKIIRQVGNAEAFVKENYFDTVVSFETIEHLKAPEKFLENINRSLKPGGTLIISTPITAVTLRKPKNPYHTIEWSFSDFQNLVKGEFDIKGIYVQKLFLTPPSAWNIFGRLKRKLSGNTNQSGITEVVKLSDKIDKKNISGGYQILVCVKK